MHVTPHPTEARATKCSDNLRIGLKPVILTRGEHVAEAGFFLKAARLADRVHVLDVGHCLTANVQERSLLPPGLAGLSGRRSLRTRIVENPPPRPIVRMLADPCFHLGAEAVDGAWYRIESSLDLRNWTSLCEAQAVQGMLHFVDPDAELAPSRFYRAVPAPEPAD